MLVTHFSFKIYNSVLGKMSVVTLFQAIFFFFFEQSPGNDWQLFPSLNQHFFTPLQRTYCSSVDMASHSKHPVTFSGTALTRLINSVYGLIEDHRPQTISCHSLLFFPIILLDIDTQGGVLKDLSEHKYTDVQALLIWLIIWYDRSIKKKIFWKYSLIFISHNWPCESFS